MGHGLSLGVGAYLAGLLTDGGVALFDIEHWPGGFHVAEADFAEAAFEDKLACLWACFRGCYCALYLLLHAVEVVILAAIGAAAGSLPEEVRLRELVQRLGRVCASADGRVDDVVEVFVCGVLGVIDRH